MRSRFTDLLKKTANRFNVGITSYGHLQELEQHEKQSLGLRKVLLFGGEHTVPLLGYLDSSKAQLSQDLFVLSQVGMKTGGFFVEFGATDGVTLSNTYLLESEFQWNGILAEPAAYWHGALKSSRKCVIETNCVWRKSDEVLTFNEVSSVKELSTIQSYSSADFHAEARKKRRCYTVKTISLSDLLDKSAAPKVIDYLSIDTEGSEYEILSAFNFEKYQFRVITCEHNFAPQRDLILALLSRHGYQRKFEQCSEFDDWYVQPSLI